MAIKITSEGRLYGTKVVDLETGEEIHEVSEIDIYIRGSGVTAKITTFSPAIDIVAEVEEPIKLCPHCRRLMEED